MEAYMGFNCPSCQSSVNNKEVIGRRREGLVTEKQCPACGAWLRLNPKMEILKNSGLIILLITSILNIALLFPEKQIIFSIMGILGAGVALFVVLKGGMVIS
jgi:endogenous inhibitor of DNA gyrase (YacG/DUF329 family)